MSGTDGAYDLYVPAHRGELFLLKKEIILIWRIWWLLGLYDRENGSILLHIWATLTEFSGLFKKDMKLWGVSVLSTITLPAKITHLNQFNCACLLKAHPMWAFFLLIIPHSRKGWVSHVDIQSLLPVIFTQFCPNWIQLCGLKEGLENRLYSSLLHYFSTTNKPSLISSKNFWTLLGPRDVLPIETWVKKQHF